MAFFYALNAMLLLLLLTPAFRDCAGPTMNDRCITLFATFASQVAAILLLLPATGA